MGKLERKTPWMKRPGGTWFEKGGFRIPGLCLKQLRKGVQHRITLPQPRGVWVINERISVVSMYLCSGLLCADGSQNKMVLAQVKGSPASKSP
jgi:hypothetical protein